MKKRARVVIGANFGDEGKGLVVDHLCATQGAGAVVRFNGGANAGHTVVTPDGERHVFQHFGAGTFCEVPTFLSQFFLLNPIQFFKERSTLIALGYHPTVFAHPDCLVTTFMDMLINQQREHKRGAKRHGSVGLGLHETVVRSTVPELKITMGDIWDGCKRLRTQMEEICSKYAKYRCGLSFVDTEDVIEHFIEGCRDFADAIHPAGIGQCDDIVFEGAQGLCLDQHNARFFPHVTHSSTGMTNVDVLCKQAGITDIEIYYVSRTYLTRHGAGPLPGEDPKLEYDDDTNLLHPFQGPLRFAPLDTADLLRRIEADAQGRPRRLVLTHCDQQDAAITADFYMHGPTRNDISRNAATEAA